MISQTIAGGVPVSTMPYAQPSPSVHITRTLCRDLKMDNTLLDDNDPPRIKLCDFGFAKWWTDFPQMSTITGTPDYMSPQLLGPKAQNKQVRRAGAAWAHGARGGWTLLVGRAHTATPQGARTALLLVLLARLWHAQKSPRGVQNSIKPCAVHAPLTRWCSLPHRHCTMAGKPTSGPVVCCCASCS